MVDLTMISHISRQEYEGTRKVNGRRKLYLSQNRMGINVYVCIGQKPVTMLTVKKISLA